jgi:hypothetical protein
MKLYAAVAALSFYPAFASAEGLRGSVSQIDEEDNYSSAMATSIKYPLSKDADPLLRGFTIGKGSLDPVFESIENCEDTDRSLEFACFETVTPGTTSTEYKEVLKDSNSRSNFMSSVTKIEGGALGKSVSTSAEYVTSSSMSQSSVSHMLGGTIAKETVRIFNISKLKLREDPKRILKDDPAFFLDTYGQHFGSSVTYGGSFLGSFDIYSKSTASSESLSIAASFEYSKGPFSVAGESEFDSHMEKSSDTLNIKSNW